MAEIPVKRSTRALNIENGDTKANRYKENETNQKKTTGRKGRRRSISYIIQYRVCRHHHTYIGKAIASCCSHVVIRWRVGLKQILNSGTRMLTHTETRTLNCTFVSAKLNSRPTCILPPTALLLCPVLTVTPPPPPPIEGCIFAQYE